MPWSDLGVTPCYLLTHLQKSHRSLLSQLQLGTLALRIETGRYDRLIESERICKVCNSGTESELHFIFHCKLYDNIRNELINRLETDNVNRLIMTRLSDIEKLKLLFTRPFVFGNYVHNIWNMRKIYLTA